MKITRMNHKRHVGPRLISACVIVSLTISTFFFESFATNGPADATTPENVILSMRSGETGFLCDGVVYDSPAPIIVEGVVLLPFRAIAEAFGADIEYEELEDIIIAEYHGSQFEYKIGDGNYTINNEPFDFDVIPRFINDSIFISASAFDSFMRTETSLNPDSNQISVKIEDDGNIRDLSELLGEIGENAVCDSYFNWRMDIPKKSILLSSSFNGDQVVIFSPLREAFIQISVRSGDVKPLEYYQENSEKITDEFYISSPEIIETDDSRYIQATFTDYGLSGILRLYVKSRYEYLVLIINLSDDYDYSYNYFNPVYDSDELPNASPFTKILDTFQIGGFDADDHNVRDLTKIIGDRIEYESYINIPENKTLLSPWSVSILPSWSVIYTPRITGAATVLGLDKDENLTVTVETPPADVTVEEYFTNYADLETARFNNELYKLISCKPIESNNYLSLEVIYSLKNGEDTFYYFDRIFSVDGLLFKTRVKMPEKRYINKKSAFISIMDSFTIKAEGISKITDNLIKQYASYKKTRLSPDGYPVEVENTEDEWKSIIPGDWVYYNRRAPTTGTLRNKIDFNSQGIYKNGSFYFDLATGANINVFKADISLLTDAPINANIDYDASKPPINGDITDNREEVTIGGNKFNVFSYTRKIKNVNYLTQYPGYEISGKIYVYNDEKDIYFIYTEIPCIFENQANTSGFDKFLLNFNAGAQYHKDGSEEKENKTVTAKQATDAETDDNETDMDIIMEILTDLYPDDFSGKPRE